MVTRQLQVERRTGKVRRPKTDVLPLCHATNHGATQPCPFCKSLTCLVSWHSGTDTCGVITVNGGKNDHSILTKHHGMRCGRLSKFFVTVINENETVLTAAPFLTSINRRISRLHSCVIAVSWSSCRDINSTLNTTATQYEQHHSPCITVNIEKLAPYGTGGQLILTTNFKGT